MKKQILMIAVAMSTLTIAANAQEKKAEAKVKKETTKDAKATTVTKKDGKAVTTKETKTTETKKAMK